MNKKMFGLISIFFFIRLVYLTQFPFFEDEALFTGWSLEMTKDISNFSQPLSMGISPLFSWATFPFIPFFPNQFIAGRFVSLLAGTTLLGSVFYTLQTILKLRYSTLSAMLFVFLPISFIYDRLALLDGLMVLLMFATIVYAYKYLTHVSAKPVFYIGILTLGILTKPIALISIPAIGIGGILGENGMRRRIYKIFILSGIAVFIYIMIFLPFRAQTGIFLGDYVTGLSSESRNGALIIMKKNIWLTLHWLLSYYPRTLLISSLIGFFIALKAGKAKRYFALTFLLLAVLIPGSARLYFPRHILIFAPFIILMTGIFIDAVAQKSKLTAIFFVLFIFVLLIHAISDIVKNPEQTSRLAKEDTFQYFSDWTSGKRLPDVAKYLMQQTKVYTRVVVWVDSRLYYYGLPVFMNYAPNVTLQIIPDNFDSSIYRKHKAGEVQYRVYNRVPLGNNSSSQVVKFQTSDRHTVFVTRLE